MNTEKRILNTLLVLFILPWMLIGQENLESGDAESVSSGDRESPQADESSVPINMPNPDDLDQLFGEENTDANNEESSGDNGVEEDESPLDEDLSLREADAISVDFPNEEIRTVLRNVADLYMINLVIPDTLQGTTSIKLRDVTWRQIFSVVLEPVGFTYVEDGNIVKIVSRDALSFEPPVTEIFMLNYAEAKSISTTLRNMVDADTGGRVQVDARTNGLIVTERQSKMGTIREVIKRLDKPTEQVLIEARFIEVTNGDVENIGVNWSSLKKYEISAGGLSREYDSNSGRTTGGTLTTDNNDELNLGSVSFSSGDEEGGSGGSGVGTATGRLTDNLTGQVLVDTTSEGTTNLVTNAVKNLTSLVDTSGDSRLTTALFSADELGVVISALKEQNDSKLVSNPTVVTLNNQEAVISVGEQFPIPNYSYNDERGTFEVSGFEYKDIGVILKVKPSVNSRGLITLNVVPEVSSKTAERSFGGAGGAAIPIISTRRTQTTVALKDGYTMGLGGLMESRGIDIESKVPVLGNLPVFGRAFRHNEKEETTVNLLIFITAKILASENSSFEDVFTEETMSKAGVDVQAFRNR